MEQLHRQPPVQRVPKERRKSNQTSISEPTQIAHQQVTSETGNDESVTESMTVQPVTTYTVASSYGDKKRAASNGHIIYKRKLDATKAKEDVKSTIENIVSRKFAEEPTMKSAKIKELKIVEEKIFALVKKKEEDSKDEESIAVNGKVERDKGVGEHCTRIYEEFVRTEGGNATNLEEPSMHTWAYHFTQRDMIIDSAMRPVCAWLNRCH